ncbi:MAG: hypothetical protein ACP5E3_16590 [Bacteroidales bacterium]
MGKLYSDGEIIPHEIADDRDSLYSEGNLTGRFINSALCPVFRWVGGW